MNTTVGYVTVTHWTAGEGGQWNAFPKPIRISAAVLEVHERDLRLHNRIRIGNYLVHALKLDDGRQWDACNGYRYWTTPVNEQPMQEGDTVRNIDIRKEILDFARQMELKMRKHDADRGNSYQTTAVGNLMHGLDHEIYELRNALFAASTEPKAVIEEAADVANFAMMLAWHCKLGE